MRFKISEKIKSLAFVDILDAPDRNSEISKFSFLLNLAVGLDYLLNFTK